MAGPAPVSWASPWARPISEGPRAAPLARPCSPRVEPAIHRRNPRPASRQPRCRAPTATLSLKGLPRFGGRLARGRGSRSGRRRRSGLWFGRRWGSLGTEDEGSQGELGADRAGGALDADEPEVSEIDDSRQAAHPGEERAELVIAALARHRDGHFGHVLPIGRWLGSEEGDLQPGLERNVGQLPVQAWHLLLGGQPLLRGLQPLAQPFRL